MLTSTDVVAFSLLGTAGLATGVFALLYKVKRQEHLLAWTGGWLLLLLHYLVMTLEQVVGAPSWLQVLEPWLLGMAALAFFCAAQVYSEGRPRGIPLLTTGSVFGLWSLAYAFGKIQVGPQVGIAAVFFAGAWLFWQEGQRQNEYISKLLSLAFFLWAPIPILGMYFAPVGSAARLNFATLAEVPQLFAAVLMMSAVLEAQERRVEHAMLALSDLNLATMNFASVEIDKTLEQALERVLGIMRLPAGAIFLRHSDIHGSTVVVSAGLDVASCRAAQEEQVDDKAGGLAAKLGGIAVFQDLEHEASWESLRDDERFIELRKFALAQGLRTVACIPLEAKDQACGVVLLGTPEPKPVSPADVRLLTTLTQQIGAAVENAYLIRQTRRRAEELHVLNEVGRALGATLDQDALFEKIFSEIERLFGVTSFYIALCDSAGNHIRFELEVVDGVRLPKRTRPQGNYLTEVILHTQQPVLIRENLEGQTRKLGAIPIEHSGSFCGVPLIAYDRVIGVMAVQRPEERCFDEGHLEMMRVLGSEASIAIENARLFREEQTKSRHLALLNSISRHAITTLNPDEMLSNIAEQLEIGLSFDHIGIGLLDYANKEVVIQAEAGLRLGALGRRLGLGENLVGQVARSGQTLSTRDFADGVLGGPMLEDSISAIALPILYAEQLHGVLYVETATPKEFSEEERLFLGTLADLISGALHNALMFQKAQEQAITDGLTGVKTHRFLMEALAAEWKRSTRAGRSFSLLLMDLDRFKFVNDFYGHLEGDLVLKRVGHILEERCRRSDVVARYGGDEFVILMPETNNEQSQQIARNLCSWISSDPLLREKRVTASLGIATFPDHGATPQELIQGADASMYLSKYQGGNTVSCAENYDPDEAKKWKRNVLEAYLGVSLKRLFSTGPEAYEEICGRIEQFAHSLKSTQATVEAAVDNEGRPNGKASDAPVVETVTALALAIDAKDHFTQGHSQKVASYAAQLAAGLGLQNEEVEEIRLGALLHDIGKVGIPEHILNKNGPLNPDEWETMKAHAHYGDTILSPLSVLTRVRAMVRHHHEMFDGSGYPDGLMGERIPLGARIIAIADAYDTITSDRVYKKARMFSAACAEIERCAGTQFDPELVRIFLTVIQDNRQQTNESAAVTVRQAAL